MNLYLIGYMGSGKSSVGKRMANRLGLELVDLDTLIEEYAKAPITDIFKESGEESFRALEVHMLDRILKEENKVVATGGGTPCHSDNLEKMLDKGFVVFLDLDVHKIVKRVSQGKQNRPLVAGKPVKDLRVYVRDHLESRLPYYRQAHLTVDADRINAKVLDTIKDAYLAAVK